MKGTFVVALLVLSSTTSFGQVGSVEKVKGNRAIVVFPDNTFLAVGQDVKVGRVEAESKGLKSRESVLSWEYYSKKITVEATSGSTTSSSESNKGRIAFGYSHNMGHYELGGVISKTTDESSSTKTNGLEIDFDAQYNFIENIDGNDFIPYLKMEYALLSGDVSTTTASGSLSGSCVVASLGMLWFPFSQLFAADFSLDSGSAQLTWKTSPSIALKETVLNFRAGWRIYF